MKHYWLGFTKIRGKHTKKASGGLSSQFQGSLIGSFFAKSDRGIYLVQLHAGGRRAQHLQDDHRIAAAWLKRSEYSGGGLPETAEDPNGGIPAR